MLQMSDKIFINDTVNYCTAFPDSRKPGEVPQKHSAERRALSLSNSV